MSVTTWRIIIAFVLLAHGLGHSLGLFPAFRGRAQEGWDDQSWILSGLIGNSVARWLGVVIWTAAMLGFIGASLGYIGLLMPSDLWRTLAISSSIISLIGLALFWNAFPALTNKIGAIGIDISVLYALIIVGL
jgi:hypothetical protein